MKIAFIRPSMFGETARDGMKPLIFAIIKPLTPDFASISFYDEMIEVLPRELDADVVAFTVDTFSASRAYQLARRYQAPGRKIIMGGFHPSAMPDECLEHCDAVIVGEAEDTWSRALQDLKEGRLQSKYYSSNASDLSQTIYDYSVFEGKPYHRIGIIQYSRGCRYHCDFCSIHAFFKGSIRCRPVEQVAADLARMKEEYIFFIDDNLFVNEAAAVQLFDAIAPLNKKWVCQISIDIAENPALLRKMKDSGCLMVLIGFESLEIANLRLMGKSANIRSRDYDRVIRNIYEAGLMIYGTFVVGYDHDSPATAMELARFAVRHRFAIANFNPLMALPGTPLYDRLNQAGELIRPRWWIDPEYRYGDAMFKPAGLTAAQLHETCRQARYTFSSLPSIARRLMLRENRRTISHLWLYLATNLISFLQIRKKQGRPLGGLS